MQRPQAQMSKKVFISVLCGDERGGWIHPRLSLFLLQTLARNHSVTLHMTLDARPVTRARNLIVEEFLKTDCEWLLMLDNDVVPPDDLLNILDTLPPSQPEQARIWPKGAAGVLVPRVYIPAEGYICLGWMYGGESVGNWHELIHAATAAMFIHREVFSKLQKPYFEFGTMPDGAPITEDLMFCTNVRKADFRIFGHRGYTCSHFRTLDLRIGETRDEFSFNDLQKVQQQRILKEAGILQ
jgi:hypothetical protein